MKYLLLLAVIVGAAWWAFGRRRAAPPVAGKPGAKPAPGGPQEMLACAHCGVHLPRSEALADPAGRLFCTEAHRLAGPR